MYNSISNFNCIWNFCQFLLSSWHQISEFCVENLMQISGIVWPFVAKYNFTYFTLLSEQNLQDYRLNYLISSEYLSFTFWMLKYIRVSYLSWVGGNDRYPVLHFKSRMASLKAQHWCVELIEIDLKLRSTPRLW